MLLRARPAGGRRAAPGRGASQSPRVVAGVRERRSSRRRGDPHPARGRRRRRPGAGSHGRPPRRVATRADGAERDRPGAARLLRFAFVVVLLAVPAIALSAEIQGKVKTVDTGDRVVTLEDGTRISVPDG